MQSIPAWAAQQPPDISTPAAMPRRNDPLLRRLPASTSGFRLGGEEASLVLPVYLTAKQAAGPARFRLATVTSVSVTPEDGTLSLSVNGVALKSVAVGAPYTQRTLDIDIPPGSLAAGWNAIGIAAHQRHRVDCSVEATDELWTRIDSAKTGLLFADGSGGIADLADLAAVSPRDDGAVTINVVLGDKRKLTPATIERLGRAITRIALTGHIAQPLVAIGDGDNGSLELVLGSLPDIGGSTDLTSLGKIAGPFVGMLPADPQQRPALVVSGNTDAELDAAIDQMTTVDAVGTAEGLKALRAAEGTPINANGQSLNFRDLGLPDREVNGRTLRAGFNLALPADFLPADYGRVSVDLAGGYAAGLSADAQVVVAINGQSAGSVRLAAANGETFSHKHMFLPLSAFRPGQNRVEIQVNAPDASDVRCDTSALPAPRARFWLSGATRISFPPLARVGRLPDLAMTASGGFPYSKPDEKTTLVVPTPDRASVGAALTLMTRLGVAAGHPLPFSFALSQPAQATGNVMVIAAARALDPARMREARLEPDVVKQAWSALADAPTSANPVREAALRRRTTQGDWPETCAIAPRPRRAPATGSLNDDLTGSFNLSRWDAVMDNRMLTPIRAALGYSGRPQAAQQSAMDFAGASLLVAQGPRETDRNAVLTIITSPTAALLNSSIACLVGPLVWPRLSGGLSSLDGSTGEITAHKAAQISYVDSGNFSLRNERLKIAGLLSLNPGIFALIALLLIGPLALTTHLLVRRLGRANG